MHTVAAAKIGYSEKARYTRRANRCWSVCVPLLTGATDAFAPASVVWSASSTASSGVAPSVSTKP